MWRLAMLRGLIALNWTVAGLASAQVVYGHRHLWHGQSYRWAREQLTRDAPDLGFGTDEYDRRSAALANEYKAQTLIVVDSGWWGWWAAMAGGAATAIGLMVMYPGVAAAVQKRVEPRAAPAGHT